MELDDDDDDDDNEYGTDDVRKKLINIFNLNLDIIIDSMFIFTVKL